MGHSVTLGGDRVGSGSKNKMYLHNYERSTHDLSQKFTSSMGVGMLIPFLVIPATRGDKFEIDLNAGLRTIPTKGPLFGSFKLQVDVYECPDRLYQALLHNNPLAIGLKANQVKFPKMHLFGMREADYGEYVSIPSATNSLIKYLGISGIGSAPIGEVVERDFNAIPLLAYYDIFKNYYANKQEENAYTLTSGKEKTAEKKLLYKNAFFVGSGSFTANTNIAQFTVTITVGNITSANGFVIQVYKPINMKLEDWAANTKLALAWGTVEKNDSIKALSEEYGFYYGEDNDCFWVSMPTSNTGQQLSNVQMLLTDIYTDTVVLNPFKLENIDKMRMDILSYHQLGQSFTLNGDLDLDSPYIDAIGNSNEDSMKWMQNLSGLCVKTYQSDLFNNWINTEWIDGENGIAAITAISTSDGKITIDAINFSEKLYNLLNRIAISGATYEDYLNAAYTDSAKKFCEAPLWIGGMSDEIVFEEIVQTAPADGDPLGTLGGRGNLLGKKKGGKITVKVDEPSFIIGIVSITPRVDYTQGNEWFMTELDNLQDLHVPALDAIGFQNLIAERMHFGTTLFEDGEIQERPVIGKIPAWLEYMTAVNKAYGDFAETDGKGYMILNRDYNVENGELLDATTYIDPQKYNYAFAYTMRDAQNFWVQIHSNIIARRLMSARQIPNL